MTAPLDLADIASWVSRHADEATYRAWLNSLDTDEFIAEIERGAAEVEQVTGRRIWRAA